MKNSLKLSYMLVLLVGLSLFGRVGLVSAANYSVAGGASLVDGVESFNSGIFSGNQYETFEDTWSFNIGEQSEVDIVLLDTVIDLGFTVLGVGDGQLIYQSSSVGVNEALELGVLSPGAYEFQVTGIFLTGGNGYYNGVVSVSAVPVPAAALLFGSALAGLVAVRRRSKFTS